MQQISEIKCFGGQQLRFSHQSAVLNCEMNFSVFLPSLAQQQDVPVLYWLSGLTCTDENFVTKSGAQRYAQEAGIALVTPDTSPRGEGVPDDPQGAYDFGLGAGFYVNATESPWLDHYQMYAYVVDELPQLMAHLPVNPERAGIAGHSMGGHGALTIGLKNTDKYSSISGFAPICSPIQCPWGQKALGHYLGTDESTWSEYDSCALLNNMASDCLIPPLLVDQGEADEFLETQLNLGLLQQALKGKDCDATVRLQPGYDHSYFFIASFIEDHINFHAKHLKDQN